jgi:hypothetical protein
MQRVSAVQQEEKGHGGDADGKGGPSEGGAGAQLTGSCPLHGVRPWLSRAGSASVGADAKG